MEKILNMFFNITIINKEILTEFPLKGTTFIGGKTYFLCFFIYIYMKKYIYGINQNF